MSLNGRPELVTVRMVFPQRVWGRLASIADHRHMTIAELLTEASTDLLGVPRRKPKTRTRVDRDDVARLHALGMSNAQIARELGASQGAITHHIRCLGLKATGNRKSVEAEKAGQHE